MTGFIDDQLRALLPVSVSGSRDGERSEILVWIDTAFNGGLTIPRKQIDALGLKSDGTTKAILADGSVAQLELFQCFLDWFGNCYRTQVTATDSECPLLGTMLLDGRRLGLDYVAKMVELELSRARAALC